MFAFSRKSLLTSALVDRFLRRGVDECNSGFKAFTDRVRLRTVLGVAECCSGTKAFTDRVRFRIGRGVTSSWIGVPGWTCIFGITGAEIIPLLRLLFGIQGWVFNSLAATGKGGEVLFSSVKTFRICGDTRLCDSLEICANRLSRVWRAFDRTSASNSSLLYPKIASKLAGWIGLLSRWPVFKFSSSTYNKKNKSSKNRKNYGQLKVKTRVNLPYLRLDSPAILLLRLAFLQ